MKIEDIVNKSIAIHCDTEVKAKQFLMACREIKVNWDNTGMVMTGKTYFEDVKELTCYTITSKKSIDEKTYYFVFYCDTGYYNKKGYEIIEFDDLNLN